MGVKIYSAIGKNIRIREQGVFTAPELITDAGLYIESAGGYYAGGNIFVGGTEYMIILAPKAQGEAERAGRSTDRLSPSMSRNNGKQNMQTMINNDSDLNTYPAANFCYNLDINGFNDWHWASPDELEVCYRFLKPTVDGNEDSYIVSWLNDQENGYNPNSNPSGNAYTINTPAQTTVSDFQTGGSQFFETDFYLSSFFYEAGGSATGAVGAQYFGNGVQGGRVTDATKPIRAVRWEEI